MPADSMGAADVEDGKRGGVTVEESQQVRELKKRNRLLKQENEVRPVAGRAVSHGDLEDAYPTNAALVTHADDPGFGYRFIGR